VSDGLQVLRWELPAVALYVAIPYNARRYTRTSASYQGWPAVLSNLSIYPQCSSFAFIWPR
jgi:hypothetical protein